MESCFIGRGSLLVSRLGAGGGFFTLSGESEISVVFTEDNESVFDARNGVNERVDWFVRNRSASVIAQCFRIEEDALELLLKANHTTQASGTGSVTLPTVVVGKGYALKPNIVPASEEVTDNAAAVVPTSKYVMDNDYGLITFSDIAGYTQPFHVDADWGSHEAYALHAETKILVKARLHGINKVSGQKFLVEFYQLAIDITPEMKLVQKPYTSMAVAMRALPDVSATIDAALGQYGRIVLLG